jgi:hypothetical protein
MERSSDGAHCRFPRERQRSSHSRAVSPGRVRVRTRDGRGITMSRSRPLGIPAQLDADRAAKHAAENLASRAVCVSRIHRLARRPSPGRWSPQRRACPGIVLLGLLGGATAALRQMHRKATFQVVPTEAKPRDPRMAEPSVGPDDGPEWNPTTARSAPSGTSRRRDGRARSMRFQPIEIWHCSWSLCAAGPRFGRSARRNQGVGESEVACAAAGQCRLPLGVH